MKAFVDVVEEEDSPIIFQTTPSTIRYVEMGHIVAMARAAAETANVPLDHGDRFKTVVECLRAGYTSRLTFC